MSRNRKPVAKSLTMGLELANNNSRELENVTDPESEKLGGDVLGRRFSEKVENVPIKKRWFMFRSPSPPTPISTCLHLEASEEHVGFQTTADQNCGSSAEQWQRLMKSDCSVKSYAPSTDDEKIPEVINGVEDLSGIEILAAAACSDSFCNEVTEYEENPVVEESTQERIQSSVFSIHFEETTASLETLSCFPKDSVNEKKSEGSSFQDNSFAVLHEFPINSGTTPKRVVPLVEFSSGKRTDLSVNESKSEGSSFQDNTAVLREIPNEKDTTPERFSPFPDDKFLWDLNVSMDTWPCDGGNVDSQKDSFDNTTVRSEELQTMEPQNIKIDTTKEMVSSDVGGGNGMTSKLRSIPAETDDLGTEKQESGYGSQDIIDDTSNEVVLSEVDGCNRMTSDLRSMPAGTGVLSAEEQKSGCDSQCIKKDATKVVVSSDFDGGNRMTSELRIMPVDIIDMSIEEQESEGCSGFDSNLQAQEPQDMKNGTSIAVVSSDVDGGNRMTSELRIMPVDIIDMTIEEQESEGCSGFDSNLQAQEPQDMKNGTSIAVVSSDVDGGNRMTSDLRTIPPETERLSTEKLESEGCSGYVSQFEDGKLRESDAQSWEEAEQVDYDTEFEEEKSFVLEAESGEQELEVERISKLEPESSKFCKTGEALGKNSVSLKIRTVEVSVGETMKFDCLDRSNYDLRVDLSKESEKESLSCVEGSLSSDVQKSMSDSFNGSYPGTERDSGSDKFMWNGRSSQMRGRSPESAQFISPSANYWDSSKRDPPHIYHSAYNFGRPGLKSAFGNREYPIGTDQAPSDAAAGVARPDHRITRSDNFNGSYLRTERCSGSDKFVWSDRSSHIHGRGPESAQYFNPSANCWDYSKQEHPHIYHSPYNFGRPVSKSTFGNREYPMGTDQAPSDAAGVTRPDHRITRQFMDSYRPILRRRSPIERDEFYNMHLRRPTVKDTVRDTSTDRNRFRRYPQGVSRGIRDEYCRHVPDDDSSQCMSRIPHRLDRRERSISPHDRRPHHALPYKRARSGSRSRSPIDWLLQRDRNADSRRCNRPPDFRSDARIDGVRLPFTKRFGAGHGEFISSPGSHVSPQQNSRMFEDRNPGLDHFSGRKSHVRMQDQRFDQTRPVRRLNSDDYFNPMIRPRRFPDRAADGKGCSKYEVSEDM